MDFAISFRESFAVVLAIRLAKVGYIGATVVGRQSPLLLILLLHLRVVSRSDRESHDTLSQSHQPYVYVYGDIEINICRSIPTAINSRYTMHIFIQFQANVPLCCGWTIQSKTILYERMNGL